MFKFELQKMCTPLTIIAIIGLLIVSSILTFIELSYNGRAILQDGTQLYDNIKSFRMVKNETPLRELDEDYLYDLSKEYKNTLLNPTFDYDYMTIAFSKYSFSNNIINFAYYGKETMTNMYNLNFDFMKSETDFYDAYKKSMLDTISYNSHHNGINYTSAELQKIENYINKLNTPFKIGYYEGVRYFNFLFNNQFILVIIVIMFISPQLFVNDTTNGIDELSLTSKLGRKPNMKIRVTVTNLIVILTYLIFIINLIILVGGICSLSHLSQSAQNFYKYCIYNLTLGETLIIDILKGLLVIILITNLVILVSIKLRNIKISLIASLGILLFIDRLRYTDNILKLLPNPLFYVSPVVSIEFPLYYFIHDYVISYIILFIPIGLLYLLLLKILIGREYKKYKIN